MFRFAFKDALVKTQGLISNAFPPRYGIMNNSATPPWSTIPAALDAELENREEISSNETVPWTSHTMKTALGTSGDPGTVDGRKGEIPVLQQATPHLHFELSNVAVGDPASSDKPVLGPSEAEVQTSIREPVSPKESTPDIPLYSYKRASPTPTMRYVCNESEANELVSKLEGPLGFDLEWRVMYIHKMSERKTAVLQLCDDTTILILQLSEMKCFPERLREIIESQDIIKLGINILGDGRKLHRDYGIAPAGLLELSHLARLVDPTHVTSNRMMSLQRIVEMYTGFTLSKGDVRTSNWEATLSEEQLEYAANDAHSALKVYTELMRIARTTGMVLRPIVAHRSASTTAMGITLMADSSTSLEGGSGNTATGHTTSPQELHHSESDSTKAMRPIGSQLLRAYQLWHEHEPQLSLPDICSALRSPEKPLAISTVVSYIVKALKADTSLPSSTIRLNELAELDFGSLPGNKQWLDSLKETTQELVRDRACL